MGGRVSAPIPPAAVVDAVAALRAAFADIHVMHECDAQCAPGCELSDDSWSALRAHDEHNFDVREMIHERAEVLDGVLEDWLGIGVWCGEVQR